MASQTSPRSQGPKLIAETPTSGPFKKRGRPRKNLLVLPGLAEPWKLDSSPSKGMDVPPSLGMFTSSPVAESPQTLTKTNKWRLGHASSSQRRSGQDNVDGDDGSDSDSAASTPTRSRSPLAQRTTLRGLSIKDVPSSPVLGYHVSFMKEDADHDDVADDEGTSVADKPLSSASLVDLAAQRPRPRPQNLKRTFSEQFPSEPYFEDTSFPASCPAAGRRVSFIIANGRARVAHSDGELPAGDDDDSASASSLSAYSVPPYQLEVSRFSSSVLASSEGLRAALLQESHSGSTLGSDGSYFLGPQPKNNAMNHRNWELSDSDGDSDSPDLSASIYSVYDSNHRSGDAMAAFAQSVARSRARERTKSSSGRRTTASSSTRMSNNHLLHTPVSKQANNYPYRYSPFIKDGFSKHANTIFTASPYAGLSFSHSDPQPASAEATTPPGLMLMADDAYGGFGNTGMTPYLPSRS